MPSSKDLTEREVGPGVSYAWETEQPMMVMETGNNHYDGKT